MILIYWGEFNCQSYLFYKNIYGSLRLNDGYIVDEQEDASLSVDYSKKVILL